MTLTRSLIIVTLASGSLWAQTPAKTPASAPAKMPAPATATAKTPAPMAQNTAAKPATPAAKPAAAITPATKPATTATTSSKPAAAPMKAAPAPVAAAKAPAPAAKPMTAKPMAAEKPKTAMAKPAEKKPMAKSETAEPVAKPASVKEQESSTRVSSAAGRRDPFVSPIVRATSGPGPICETGKRCLMVDQIVLKGIVKSPNGFIAVVENPLKRAYFLRENDPVFNGSVVRITGDSVTFREMTTDKLGKQSMREVVKKVNAPVV